MKPRKIKWKPQPRGSDQCGQACVAMISKVSLKRAVEACGKPGKTSGEDLLRGLRTLGVQIKGARLIPVTGSRMPQRCIQKTMFVHYGGKSRARYHWRIRWDGHIYDPEFGVSFLNGSKPSEAWWSRVISYIEL